jgi:hypothetical protein
MERILTTKEATVQTVQVEIKVLKVGKKQVTMGLFRQLKRRRLLDPETVQLHGVPWGHVNYRWEGDGRQDWRDDPYLHVVWQLGEALYRDVIYSSPNPDILGEYQGAVEAGIIRWFLGSLAAGATFAYALPGQFQERRTVTIHDRQFTLRLDNLIWRAINEYIRTRDMDIEAEADAFVKRSYYPIRNSEKDLQEFIQRRDQLLKEKEDAQEQYRQLLLTHQILNVPPQDLLAQVREAQNDQQQYKDAWAKQWQVLSALPQLFIAV